MANLDLVALIVREYEPAIRFFVDVLQVELVEDTPSLTNDGIPKRWVVVRPAGARTGILLARADSENQVEVVGRQFAGRVGLFLRVQDFDGVYQRMINAAVRFVSEPRVEPYGKVAVFHDLEGNRWDLLGAPGRPSEVNAHALCASTTLHKRRRCHNTSAACCPSTTASTTGLHPVAWQFHNEPPRERKVKEDTRYPSRS